ncbi:MAG TPA: nuclear transport factor 2 family protein [Candidatus Acidoferrales bacterium]|nr:nuclear transport factor 2 family protein [Candidatus Acidoferrales bacterium]
MNIVERFTAYAAAFEDAYASDDWSKLDPFFTDDAVYETFADPPFGGAVVGRAAIKAHFKQICASFDKRFDSRAVEMVTEPSDRGGSVWFRWAAIYTLAGAPTLRMDGEETAIFDGDRIRRLEDRIPTTSVQTTAAYLMEHGAKLKPLPA